MNKKTVFIIVLAAALLLIGLCCALSSTEGWKGNFDPRRKSRVLLHPSVESFVQEHPARALMQSTADVLFCVHTDSELCVSKEELLEHQRAYRRQVHLVVTDSKKAYYKMHHLVVAGTDYDWDKKYTFMWKHPGGRTYHCDDVFVIPVDFAQDTNLYSHYYPFATDAAAFMEWYRTDNPLDIHTRDPTSVNPSRPGPSLEDAVTLFNKQDIQVTPGIISADSPDAVYIHNYLFYKNLVNYSKGLDYDPAAGKYLNSGPGTAHLSHCKELARTTDPGIPDVIHFVFEPIRYKKMPAKWRHALRRVREQNPGARVMVWDFAKVEALLDAHFGPAQRELWDRMDHFIYKLDYCRFLFLYVYGGIYMDLDMALEEPVDMFRMGSLLLTVEFPYDYFFQFTNGFMGCAAGHPLMQLCIQNAATSYDELAASSIPWVSKVISVSGPIFLTLNFLMWRADEGDLSMIMADISEFSQKSNPVVKFYAEHGFTLLKQDSGMSNLLQHDCDGSWGTGKMDVFQAENKSAVDKHWMRRNTQQRFNTIKYGAHLDDRHFRNESLDMVGSPGDYESADYGRYTNERRLRIFPHLLDVFGYKDLARIHVLQVLFPVDQSDYINIAVRVDGRAYTPSVGMLRVNGDEDHTDYIARYTSSVLAPFFEKKGINKKVYSLFYGLLLDADSVVDVDLTDAAHETTGTLAFAAADAPAVLFLVEGQLVSSLGGSPMDRFYQDLYGMAPLVREGDMRAAAGKFFAQPLDLSPPPGGDGWSGEHACENKMFEYSRADLSRIRQGVTRDLYPLQADLIKFYHTLKNNYAMNYMVPDSNKLWGMRKWDTKDEKRDRKFIAGVMESTVNLF